ncbi:MAG: hypothetical protein WA892_00490 [Ornithinimicrobium sp.]
MTDTLLQSLRARLLDESEPLAGLLRICLMLGAETRSEALREWARLELGGYSDSNTVPSYRELGAVILYDSISGNTWATGLSINPLQLPGDAHDDLPAELTFAQPIEELEQLSKKESMSFGTGPLALAEIRWNRQLGAFQRVMNLRYTVPGSAIAGIIGQVRTNLVEIVADLTADTPLTELPKKDQVDAAVAHRIGQGGGDVYNTTIQQADGPVAIGAEAQAVTGGLSVQDALKLLDKVQEAAGQVDASGELLEAVADLRATLDQDTPDTGEVVKKVGKMRAVADKLGVAAVTAATSSAATTLTELALGGAFG